jgi:hypothetical protein
VPQWVWKDHPDAQLGIGTGTLAGERSWLSSHERAIVPTCDQCQRWLTTNFETPAEDTVRPMTRGEPLVLDRDQQAFVAAYMIKTCMLISVWKHARKDAAISLALRKQFRRTAQPPAGSTVWIGCLMDDYEETPSGLFLGRDSLVPTTFAEDPFYLPSGVTGGAFHFVRLFTHWVLDPDGKLDASEAGLGIPSLAEAERLGVLTRIWPVTQGTVDFGSTLANMETYTVLHEAMRVS